MKLISVADNLNGLNPVIADSLSRLDPSPIQELVRRCESAGAAALDINPGYLPKRKTDRMRFFVETVQSVTDLPLILDSPHPEILAAGLQACEKPPILNGISLEARKTEEIIPLAVEHGCNLILLLMDERSFTPVGVEEKIAVAIELRQACLDAGLEEERLIYDPILPNLSWEDASIRIGRSLETVRLLESGAVFGRRTPTSAGFSNLRSGLRRRASVEFELHCIALFAGAGLTFGLINALDDKIMSLVHAVNALID
jgi:cobalamin-dependent methionine synthase I